GGPAQASAETPGTQAGGGAAQAAVAGTQPPVQAPAGSSPQSPPITVGLGGQGQGGAAPADGGGGGQAQSSGSPSGPQSAASGAQGVVTGLPAAPPPQAISTSAPAQGPGGGT